MSYDPHQYPPTRQFEPAPYQPPAYQPAQAFPPPPPMQPGWQPGQPVAPVPAFPPPPGSRGRKGPAIVIVAAAVLAICVGAVVADDDADPSSSAAVTPPETTVARAKAAPEKKTLEKAPETTTFDVAVGSTITSRDGKDVQTATLRSVKTFKKGCNSLDVNPEQGLYVVVDVLVTQKAGSGTVNPLDFEFVAEDGTTANALSSVFSGCAEPSLTASDLRPGQKRAGKIAFDAGMKAGAVEWSPGGFGSDTVGSWATR
ncbi:DUF4352 domain-containing protein [Actinoplanes regularis]|uniref:DUF4352 domain-containing protein n=1 Tax=Actinoplanes regularis TaxID=52697 RepID=A0A239JB41_9ACTN|nr:DUF4352 domain-containing protein [Actinoplanes regularis]GIE91784.1 hypothetical protein Are01nite_82640 [Actinoplanes regularis]SNT03035.1 protein of unknown function [Actinoplanes regularis]